MGSNLKKWQRSLIRNNIEKYRESLESYYIKNKPEIDMGSGFRAYSLVSPALGSLVAKRRLRFILNDMVSREDRQEKGDSISWESRTPHFITIAVTYNCQCDCKHCSAYLYQQDVKKNNSALTTQELKDAVKQTVDMGTTCVVFTGGEPLLVPDIYELVKHVDKKKSICTVFTNGELLTEENVKKLKESGVFGVFVSFDFADAKAHDENRKKTGIFDKAIAGIKLCQKHKILTGISTYGTREKIENGELDKIMDLAKKLNVLEVFLFDVIPTGRLSESYDCMLSENNFVQVNAFREKYNTKSDYPRILHQTMFTSIAYPCVAEGCPAGIAQVHLRGNGDVTPCDFTPFAFGNIRKRPLKEIWNDITKHELYAEHSKHCRLSRMDFWNKAKESFKNKPISI